MPKVEMTSKNPLFIEPPKPKADETAVPKILTERYDRLVASYRRAHLNYIPDYHYDDKTDTRERVNQYYIGTSSPECVKYTLLSMVRVLLPNSPNTPLFEGPAPDYKPDSNQKSALIVNVRVDVLNEDSVKRGIYTDILNQEGYKLGVYPQVIPKISYDHKGNITNSEISSHRNVYFIRDTREEIDNMIKLFGPVTKGYRVAQPRIDGNIVNTRTVPNFEEFCNEPIELLIRSNEKGLLGTIPGGTKIYKTFEAVMQNLVSTGVYPQSKFDNITRQEVLELIEKHGNNNKQTGPTRAKKKTIQNKTTH